MLVYATGTIRDWVGMVVEMLGSERFQSRYFGLANPFQLCSRMFQNTARAVRWEHDPAASRDEHENFGVLVAEARRRS